MEKVIRSRVAVTIDGVDYESRSDAAKALVAAGKSLPETAKMTGMSYQTVYTVTKGKGKYIVRRLHYRIVQLGRGGNKTAVEIAKKVGVSTGKVIAILEKAGVSLLTKEQVAKNKLVKQINKVKSKKVDAVPLTLQQVIAEEMVDLSTEDDLAMQAAMADMSHEE